jgi:ribosomal protein S18 acetylase RimI-like enzyme
MPLTFRFASGDQQEIAAIVALVESAYRGEPSRAGWTTEADLLDGQRTDPAAVADVIAAGPPGGVLLAGDADDLVACCQLEPRAGGEAYFGMFAVRPSGQGRGWGRAVVSEAERIARQDWQATAMTMTVIRQREDLIAWYGRLGYRPTGATQPFPYGDERFGIPLRPDLEFIVLRCPLD